jgi:hypothetical protein
MSSERKGKEKRDASRDSGEHEQRGMERRVEESVKRKPRQKLHAQAPVHRGVACRAG